MTQPIILAIEHIARTPGISGGSPHIAGRRVPVHHIVYAYEHLHESLERIQQSYNLSSAQIYAALAYYHDHKAEIDAIIIQEEELEAGLEVSYWQASLLKKHLTQGTDNPEMTVAEVAKRYAVSPQAVRKACKEGWLPARKSGSTWLIKRADAHRRWHKPRPE